MDTTEVLTGIMGVTVILMNLYRLTVSITGFEVACSPGQYGKGGACHPCPIGRFNEHHAAVCCQHCPYLYLTWGRGAKSRHECSGVLHDLLIGLAVLACLSINLYALFKFTGPVVLDSLCEYVGKEGSESKPGPETGCSDDVLDSGMPENVFDGISRLIVRLKERKLREGSEEDVPLLPAPKSNARSEDSEVVAHDSDTALPDGEDFVPETVSPTPASPDDIASGAASLEDTFVSPELQSLDEGSTSSPDGAETSLSEVAFAGSPEADWIASGRRQWISRYHFVAGRSGTSEGHDDSSLPDERQATYDLYIGRWSNDEPDTSDASHSLEDKSSGIVGAKVRRTLGSSSRTATSLDDTAFDGSSVMLPPHSRAVSTRGNSSLDDVRFSGPSKFRPEAVDPCGEPCKRRQSGGEGVEALN
ncbi:hypothetical protein V5799_000091 [Amblyomma americanum]|uniref:Tyrosine-protein kinase ephrin type A/B receptor-like domain-containing protein n=1 Tax=Amblyomma americanum TaxID=6943 RepID=A0AAQ4D418_AMBAM